MAFAPNDPWLRDLLAVVKTRPGMWVPGPETVRNLETYLIGYRQARADLGLPDYGAGEENLLEDFGPWLAKHLGSKKDFGWAGYIEETDPGPKNVRTFFSLFEAFLEERGMVLPSPEKARWPADAHSFKRTLD